MPNLKYWHFFGNSLEFSKNWFCQYHLALLGQAMNDMVKMILFNGNEVYFYWFRQFEGAKIAGFQKLALIPLIGCANKKIVIALALILLAYSVLVTVSVLLLALSGPSLLISALSWLCSPLILLLVPLVLGPGPYMV